MQRAILVGRASWRTSWRAILVESDHCKKQSSVRASFVASGTSCRADLITSAPHRELTVMRAILVESDPRVERSSWKAIPSESGPPGERTFWIWIVLKQLLDS